MESECDYCGEPLPPYYQMRAVGFTEWEGHEAPLVKTHCGTCEVPDDIDPEAHAALQLAIRKQLEANQ